MAVNGHEHFLLRPQMSTLRQEWPPAHTEDAEDAAFPRNQTIAIRHRRFSQPFFTHETGDRFPPGHCRLFYKADQSFTPQMPYPTRRRKGLRISLGPQARGAEGTLL